MPAITKIDVTPETLNLEWDDGSKANLRADFLRGHCLCAHCVSEVSGELLIDRTKISADIKITKAEPMGHYAVSLGFSDFHATGIYSYEHLRKLAQS